MTKYKLITILAALLLLLPAYSQKRKTIAQPAPTPEELAHQEKIASMTANTEKVMFIDSMVVAKADFLSHYTLNAEAGRIARYQDQFKSNRHPDCYIYLNALGNKCFLAQQNNEGIINLYSSEIVGNKWTRPAKLRGINDDRAFSLVNYPYMMGDGSTFYFSAQGGDGLGGYDIYTTTLDESGNRFLRPVNIGMPFNSEANDYMYVIDEYNNIGWFASDRNQPEGMVCIYVFVPSSVRQTYDPARYTPEEISRFARISDITLTWDDELLLGQALARLKLASGFKQQQATGRAFAFVVNDDATYYTPEDFRVASNRQQFRELLTLQARLQALDKALGKARDYYVSAKGDERQELADEILASEKKRQEIIDDIHTAEKHIRNTENIYLSKNK